MLEDPKLHQPMESDAKERTHVSLEAGDFPGGKRHSSERSRQAGALSRGLLGSCNDNGYCTSKPSLPPSKPTKSSVSDHG